MTTRRQYRLRTATTFIFFALVACNPAFAQDKTDTLEPITVQDIDASGDPVHFSLRENRIVPADEVTSDNWDVSFQGTTILVNESARLVDRPFDYVASAPEEGYTEDDTATGTAIPVASGEGWFDYDPTTHIVSTVPDRTIIVKTPAGTYAKMEILSYYEGRMPEMGSPRFYTFRFVHQPDGTRKFR